MSDHSANSEVPSLHWTELQLMQYLAQAWSMPDPGHISVIGRLRFAETGSFGFLENLHDATTGVNLPSLAPISQLQQGVFVPGPELNSRSFQWGPGDYAVAVLSLAPLQRRHERSDPLACMVRPHSLTPLSRVPKSWGVTSLEGEDSSLLLDMARRAIQAQLDQDHAELLQQLERTRQAHAQELDLHETARNRAIAQQHELLGMVCTTPAEPSSCA